MKGCVLVSLIVMAGVGNACADEGKFSQSVLSEDFAALGLTKLSPEELSRLDAKIEAYKSGALTAARHAADAALAAKQAAEAQAARSEAEAKAAKSLVEKTRQVEQNRFAQANSALMPAVRAEQVTIESTIPGRFRGWEGRQVFVLANGQRWQVANSESYYAPTVEDIKVRITHAAVTGYWLSIPSLDTRVRVVPVEGK